SARIPGHVGMKRRSRVYGRAALGQLDRPAKGKDRLFRLGYNTNGLAHHRVLDALELVAELGYEALSITPDVGQLDPSRLDREEVARVRARAEELGLELTLETGARFLLDPFRKHRPNLLDDEPAERARRVELLLRHVDLAADLGASVVALWAGAASDGSVG